MQAFTCVLLLFGFVLLVPPLSAFPLPLPSPPLFSPPSVQSSEAPLPWCLLGLPGPALGELSPEPALSTEGDLLSSFRTPHQALGWPGFSSSGSAGGERWALEACEPPLRDGFTFRRLPTGSFRAPLSPVPVHWGRSGAFPGRKRPYRPCFLG